MLGGAPCGGGGKGGMLVVGGARLSIGGRAWIDARGCERAARRAYASSPLAAFQVDSEELDSGGSVEYDCSGGGGQDDIA